MEEKIKSTVLRPLADKFIELAEQSRTGEYKPKSLEEATKDTERYVQRAYERLEKLQVKGKISKLVETVILADAIMTDFNKRGMAADFVYYELLEETQQYVTGHSSTKDFVDYLSMIFGFDGVKHFNKVNRAAKKHQAYIESIMDGTWNPE